MTTPAAMNNLHRGLALIMSAAWARIEEGVRHAFRRRVADRCVLDEMLTYLTYTDRAVVVQEASDLP
ncbi:hypothetical protein [Streptomyces sp. NPDC057582]|uniref:hypothetical protein n=1 Tax=Streptomyces sp. NPDC057582 TaxID=3346174 RepID=UPI003696A9CB